MRTTCISLYEFLRGLSYLGKQAGEYKAYLESNLDVLPLDNKAVLQASVLYGTLKRRGALVEDPDLLIASMCIANGLPVVTGNSKHFERFKEFGLSVRQKDEFLASVRES
ncbi:MAG: PIN domain-containing protein [Nitrososphaerota archaeon]|nr:PIN domain-containing protein [Nitrososphaerota archaeon]